MSYLNASWRGINSRDKEKRRPELGFRQSWTLAPAGARGFYVNWL